MSNDKKLEKRNKSAKLWKKDRQNDRDFTEWNNNIYSYTPAYDESLSREIDNRTSCIIDIQIIKKRIDELQIKKNDSSNLEEIESINKDIEKYNSKLKIIYDKF